MNKDNRGTMSAFILSPIANPKMSSSTRRSTDSDLELPLPHFSFMRTRLAKLLFLFCLLVPLAEPAWAFLPINWTDADIGSPGLAGSAGDTNGNWTVFGGGTDIYGTSDQFNYAYQT